MGPGVPDATEIPVAMRVRTGPVPASPQANGTQPSAAGDNDKLDRLKGTLTRYTLDFVVAASGVQLETAANGTHHGKLEAALVVYDQDGQALNWIVRQLDLDLDAPHYALEQRSGVNFGLTIDVPQSGAYLCGGVYDWTSNLAGTLEFPLRSVQAGHAPGSGSR